jgi:hypothetical protein
MREFVRLVTAASSMVCITAAIAVLFSPGALAQPMQAAPKQMAPAPQSAPQPALKQMPLTDKQVQGVLAAQPDMDNIADKVPESAAPDGITTAQLDAVARKNGFASYDEYNNVIDNVGLVLGGFDPATKKYVGVEAVIKAQIAEVESNKNMSAKQKKDAIADLNRALASPPPAIENKGNIDLVAKYYDKLAAALGDDDE